MERCALIHSFHSQVNRTLARLQDEPDVILALDSHMDTCMGTKELFDLMPEGVRLAALRASAHTMIRRTLGDFPILLESEGLSSDFIPEMMLAVPKVSFRLYSYDLTGKVQQIVPYQEFEDPEEYVKHITSDLLGIEIYTCPPKKLLYFVKILRGTWYSLLDLDVDYLREMQDECYTPLRGAKPNQLGSMIEVMKLIRKTKPNLITISEAKVSAIQNRESNFSKFVNALKRLRYRIEYVEVFQHDDEAECYLRIHEDYYKRIVEPRKMKMSTQIYLSSDRLLDQTFERQLEELENATRRYFKSIKMKKPMNGGL